MKSNCSLILLTGILLISSTTACKKTTILNEPTTATATPPSTAISSTTSVTATTSITTNPTTASSPSTSTKASTTISPSTSEIATTTATSPSTAPPEPSTMSTTSTTKIPCPEGWMDASYMDLGCIFFANRGFSWADADNYCQENSSALIEVYSQTHMDFIRSELFVLENFVGEHVWWTGGSDVGREGQWYWTHTLTDI